MPTAAEIPGSGTPGDDIKFGGALRNAVCSGRPLDSGPDCFGLFDFHLKDDVGL